MGTAEQVEGATSVTLAARISVAVLVFATHFVASTILIVQAYGLYDTHWSHADPAFAVPTWGALPLFLPVFTAFGFASFFWNRRAAYLSVVPVILAFFFWLGGMRVSEYYEGTLWDIIGRPPLAAAVVGLGSGVAAGVGWLIGRHVVRRRQELAPQSCRPTMR
jgi:hypothetical protein